MTALRSARRWAGAASALAQISATAAGMLPWWALPLTLAVTAFVTREPGPADPRRTRATRGIAVAAVAIFAGLIVAKSVGAGSAGADPVATLRSLTEALVVLSLVIAPASRTPREYRVWLTVTTGVLVAAAAGGRSATTAVLSASSWLVLLTAIARVQIASEQDGGAVIAADPLAATTRVRPARPTSAVAPVIAALVAGVLVFFALPAGLGGGGLATTIAHHVRGTPNSQAPSRSVVGVDTYGDGELSLLVRGPLPTTPILWVPASSPSLWRGTFYRTYTGTSWQDNPIQRITAVNGPSADVPQIGADPASGTRETDRVRVAPGVNASLIWAPGVPVHIKGRPGQVTRVVRSESNTRVFGQHPLQSYTVTSAVATTKPAALRVANGSDPTNRSWTQLPAGLPANIAQLAHQITRHANNRYAQVTDLETYLRAHETYSLNSPVPGAGEDAVEDFLFRDHTGFCEQFASAEAVMLRTLGVPARVVSGLAYGARAGRTRVYTEADAHAWVEVYYPGIGWSATDPTAGAQLASSATSSRSSIGRVLHALATALPGGRIALIVTTFALCLLVGALIQTTRRRRKSVRGKHAPTPIGPVLAAFNRLTRDRWGPAPRAPAETAREYLGRVAPPGSIDAALLTLEQECYGATEPATRDADSAVDAFGALVSRP